MEIHEATFETTATVLDHGQVHLGGVPFEPGTEVEVMIRAKAPPEAEGTPSSPGGARVSLKDVFARVQARNTEPVGPLRREELYDRKVLR